MDKTFETDAYESVEATSFLDDNLRAFLMQTGFGIFLLNLMTGDFVVYHPESVGSILFSIYFTYGFLDLMLVLVIVSLYYGYGAGDFWDRVRSARAQFHAWVGLILGAFAGIFISYVSVAVFSNIVFVFWAETVTLGALCFLLVMWDYRKDSRFARASDFARQGGILKDKGDLYGAILNYIKSASTDTVSKIGQVSIHMYNNLALNLAGLSVLWGSAEKAVDFLTRCQKRLKKTSIDKQVTSRVDSLIENLASANKERILDMFLDTKEAETLLNLLRRSGETDLSVLSAEYRYDGKMVKALIEIAVRNGKLEGFFRNDETIFITRNRLRQELSDRLANAPY